MKARKKFPRFIMKKNASSILGKLGKNTGKMLSIVNALKNIIEKNIKMIPPITKKPKTLPGKGIIQTVFIE